MQMAKAHQPIMAAKAIATPIAIQLKMIIKLAININAQFTLCVLFFATARVQLEDLFLIT